MIQKWYINDIVDKNKDIIFAHYYYVGQICKYDN